MASYISSRDARLSRRSSKASSASAGVLNSKSISLVLYMSGPEDSELSEDLLELETYTVQLWLLELDAELWLDAVDWLLWLL
jgi:hypothetical protein